MAENKKHHYIPKFYLRSFSVNNDELNIGLYNLQNKLFKSSVPLKDQAYENYFYGQNNDLEKSLGDLENLAAPNIKNVILNNILPKRVAKETTPYHSVLAFAAILDNRTKDTEAEINDMSNQLAKLRVGQDGEMSKLLEKYSIVQEDAVAFGIKSAALNLHTLFDLKGKLLINRTNTKFITSDSPVIKFNQFLNSFNTLGSNLGYVSRGLQILFPISPNHLIIYYDDWVYKIGEKKRDEIELTNPHDINLINSLQVLNCYKQLYFNNDANEKYIVGLCDKNIAMRPREYSKVIKIADKVKTNKGEGELFNTYRERAKINLNLPFVGLTKRAKKIEIKSERDLVRYSSMKYGIRTSI